MSVRKTVLLAAGMLTLVACGGGEAPAPPPAEPPPPAGPDAGKLAERAKAMFQPLPDFAAKADAKPSDDLIALGRMLYYEQRISKNHDLSCNSCHKLDQFGVDGEPTSPGHKGQRGERNSPTTFNAALHATQFWDGRSPDVEDQAKGPVLNPVEMAMPDDAHVITVLKSIPGYEEAFKKAFPDQPDPITYDNFGLAVGAFERGLLTPSPFDKFLAGDLTALNAQQLEGLQTYMDVGCATCHAGPALGGNGFFKLGQVKPYETADEGRYKVTNVETDKYFFKPPGLRNITKTSPYYHDGSVGSLDEAVKLMASHQLGKDLTDAEVKSVIAFLDALTGEVPAAYVAKPELPESGPKTPAPDPS